LRQIFANALKKMNGVVGWRVLVDRVAGRPGRVQHVNHMEIAELVMSTDGAQYTVSKLQTTLTLSHKECHKW
jgi:hypothetical protein